MGHLREFIDQLIDSFTNVFKFDVDPDLEEKENVDKVISQTALVAGMIGTIQPIPFADMLLLAPLHVKMTLQIGKIKGYEVTEQRANDIVKEIVGVAWMHLTAQALIGIVGKVIPLARLLLNFPLNYAATWAIGRVADYYFDCVREGTIPSQEVMKDLFAEQFKVGKKKGNAFDQDEMARRAEELRARVAKRDPDLVTSTRMRPKDATVRASRAAAAAVLDAPPQSRPSGSESALRKKIKISIPKKGPSHGTGLPPRVTPGPTDTDEAEDEDEEREDEEHEHEHGEHEHDEYEDEEYEDDEDEGPAPSAKTIGPDPDDEDPIEIGYRRAQKTVGEPDAPKITVSEKEEPETLEALLPGVTVQPRTVADDDDDDDDEQPSLVDQLERLASLLEAGVLDKEEFDKAKQKLLDGEA